MALARLLAALAVGSPDLWLRLADPLLAGIERAVPPPQMASLARRLLVLAPSLVSLAPAQLPNRPGLAACLLALAQPGEDGPDAALLRDAALRALAALLTQSVRRVWYGAE